MSANPFAALGEDGQNLVAAKGAIFFGKELLTELTSFLREEQL